MRRVLAAASLALVAACATATFTPEEDAHVGGALALQANALADPRFADVLRELEAEGAIEWNERLAPRSFDEARGYPTFAEWLLARFARDGGLPREALGLSSKPFSSARAAYDPADRSVALNRWNIGDDLVALANTFIHERTHSFGLVHMGQSRSGNQCDPGYIAGDLAEAVLRASPGETSASDGPVCPALCRALERRGMWTHRSCGGA